MSNQPLVSIIICTHNGEKFLAEQLKSIEKQTYAHVEIICSDDNSNDNTTQILRDWCKNNDCRKFVLTKEAGLNKNFFNAIKHASGEYVIFCDQDDIWLPHKVEKLVAFHEKNKDAKMVYCLSQKFIGEPSPIKLQKKSIKRLEGSNVKQTLLYSFTLGHNILIKKDVLNNIPVPTDEIIAYDWWITVSCMCMGKIFCLNEILTHWRQHENNTTKKINEDPFYISRLKYLDAFSKNPLISNENLQWIKKAQSVFIRLSKTRFSFLLFCFMLKNAPFIFYYKQKKNPFFKCISFIKWSIKTARRNYNYR